jgi:transposase-like protein
MDRDRLASYLEAGLSVRQIAELTGKNRSTVSYWLRQHRLHTSGSPGVATSDGISKEMLEPLVQDGKTIREIARRTGRSESSVRYWIARHGLPSPFEVRNGYRRQPLDRSRRYRQRECPVHGQTVFVLERSGHVRCRQCRIDAVTKRRREIKRLLVQEAGGACALCGYDAYLGALQFHHRDPSAKSFSLSGAGVTRSLARARAEAAKCDLLCANCHAEVEAGKATLP